MWFFYALMASIFWGINYALAEKIGQRISLISLITLEMALGSIVLGLWAYFTTLKLDLNTLWTNRPLMTLTLVEIGVMLLANVAIVLSIQAKNATSAGLIELSYPLFIILTSWVLFHEHHLNLPIIIGSAFISVGVICVSLG